MLRILSNPPSRARETPPVRQINELAATLALDLLKYAADRARLAGTDIKTTAQARSRWDMTTAKQGPGPKRRLTNQADRKVTNP